MNSDTKRVIVALDFLDIHPAIDLAKQLDPELCRVKVGKVLSLAAGPSILHALSKLGFEVFLDLKFHDVPHQVGLAVQVAAQQNVWMCNVHACGGIPMMEAAASARNDMGSSMLITAVTVLTSLNDTDLNTQGIRRTRRQQVQQLAKDTEAAGLDGVVCAATDLLQRPRFQRPFLRVVPGIRPAGTANDDQKEIATPEAAITAGADYLVIGRPVTGDNNPGQALADICHDIGKRNP